VAEWRGSVTSDLEHLKGACERIESAIIRHAAEDDTRFARVEKQTSYLLTKVAGIIAASGTVFYFLP
jgi:hypothetical protein